MRLPIIVRPAARIEFDEAANWYEDRSAGRGAQFTRAVRAVLDRISDSPLFYAEVYEDVREALLKGYPYCVYYRAEPDHVVVLAVFPPGTHRCGSRERSAFDGLPRAAATHGRSAVSGTVPGDDQVPR